MKGDRLGDKPFCVTNTAAPASDLLSSGSCTAAGVTGQRTWSFLLFKLDYARLSDQAIRARGLRETP